jgi:hypothetical protein
MIGKLIRIGPKHAAPKTRNQIKHKFIKKSPETEINKILTQNQDIGI